jgi:uncharacterized protein YndB with AHSA1/START domain
MKRWAWWVVLAIGIVLAVPLSAAALGMFVPESHSAASRVVLPYPPEQVWDVIADFERWPEWNSAFDAMERQPDRQGQPYWIGRGGFGPLPMLVETFDPPRKLVTRIPEDAHLGFGGSWTYEIAPAPEGCTLTVREDGVITNPLFRTISRFVTGYHATLESFLVDAGAHLGQEVTPQRVRL